MKNLTNILSYLWLLLLMAVTACSDLEEEVGPMQGEEEVELTIQTEVSGMKGSTRTAPTESITAITAYAFDSNSQLIKVVKAILSDDKQSTSGYLKIKVPKRTGDIHFIAKNSADTPDVNIKLKDNVSTLLNQTSTTLHYWGKATYNEDNNLSVTLIRNMAKVTLTLNNNLQGHIAGFVNYNQSGKLVPGNFEVRTLNATNDVASHNIDSNLDIEHYLFEHANDANNSPLYAICKIGELYYKIAFAAKVDEVSTNFQIVRNHAYTITINSVEESLGGTYDEALLADPINDANVEVQAVTMEIQSVSLTSYKGNTCQVTVTVPNGVTKLSVTPDDAFSVTSATLDDVAISPNNDVYIVTGGSTAKFSLTLNDNFIGTTGGHKISFEGSGALVNATGTATITLNGFVDMYEMYFDDGNLGGSTEYDKFFYDKNNVNLQTKTLTTQYVDAGANNSTYAHNHVNAAINMQSNSTIKFTIAEERYLTLLVARKDNAPSINLLKNGDAWTATSDKTQVPTTYNFSKDGDITTSGRLIRYTLPAGTYTLQGGNNDYLLYYMRVSTNRPTMTDANALLQPTNDNYRFWWSGGEYGNWTYVENVGYVVDDDAKTFNVALTDDYLNNNGITGGELSLNSLQLNVTNSSFNNNSRDYTNTNNNSNVEISEINSGTYTYTIGAGVINNPVYKYTNFYDKIPVNAVNNGSKTLTVKNSLKLKLVDGETSYNGKENIVEYYTTETPDPRLAIVSPAAPLKPHGNNNPFVCTIQENWQFKGANNKQIENNNQQVNLVSQNGNTFTIANGTEHYNNEDWEHPFWMTYIYYFDWGDFTDENNTNRTLSDITIATEDADVWFSYKGMDIAKSLKIKVNENPGEVVSEELNLPLNIALDFYTKDGNGTRGSDFSNLIFGESRVVLEATITIPQEQNPADYIGKKVYLQGAFSNDSRWLIHWDNSRDGNNSDIEFRDKYNHDGTNLQFTIENDKTVYDIEWVFVRNNSEPSVNSVDFTYTISSDNANYSVTGEKSASLVITRPKTTVLLNTPHTFTTEDNGNWTSLTFNGPFPVGTKIILSFSKGGGIKLCDGSNNNLYVPEFVNQFTHGTNDNLWMSVPTGDLVLDITGDVILYGKGTGNYNGKLSDNPLSALVIESGETVLDRVVVVYPEGDVEEEEEVVFTGPFTFTDWNNMSVDGTFSVGTMITFKFSAGGLFKIHNGSWQMLYIPLLENRYPQEGYNRYIVVEAREELSFVVDNNIRFQTMNYDTNELTGDSEFTDESFSGLVLQGDGGTVLESITITTP